jgi:hypothetical protein
LVLGSRKRYVSSPCFRWFNRQTLSVAHMGNRLRDADLKVLAMSRAVSARPPPSELGSVSSPLAVHSSRVGSDSSFTAWASAAGEKDIEKELDPQMVQIDEQLTRIETLLSNLAREHTHRSPVDGSADPP